ncbi:unnamed protein product, partial [marine sediment metagenome]
GIITDLISPIDAYNSSITSMEFIVNSTPIAIDLTNVTLYIWNDDNTVYHTNFSEVTGTVVNQTTWNITEIPDGDYIWNAITWGTSNKSDWDTNRTFTIDTTVPIINIVYPENISYTDDVSNLNYAFTEANPDSCWYSLDEGTINSSRVDCGTNWTGLTSTEGSNTWTVYINCSLGCTDQDSVTFFKDSILPNILITSPSNNSNHSINTIDINYTVSDTNLDSCWYSNDTYSTNTTITCGQNITTIIWSDGQHNVTIWANDSLNNVNSSSVTFTIDTTNPEINITDPIDFINYHLVNTNLTFN